LGVGGSLFDPGFSYVAGEGLLDFSYAGVDVFGGALGEHLDGPVKEVADEAGQLVAMGDAVSGEAKTDALDVSDEDYVLGGHWDLLFSIYYLLLTIDKDSNSLLGRVFPQPYL